MKVLFGRAPVRISFGGGGTDLADYYERFGGAVLSTSIDQCVYIMISERRDKLIRICSADLGLYREFESVSRMGDGDSLDLVKTAIRYFRPATGLDVYIASSIPAGSGLGLSGAVTVDLVNLLSRLKRPNSRLRLSADDRGAIAETASRIEIDLLGRPIGRQDQYASAYGGLNFIAFSDQGVRVAPVRLKPSTRLKLQNSLMLFYTKQSRDSAVILARQKAQSGTSEPVIERLHRIKELAYKMRAALEADQPDLLGEQLHQSWLAKRALVKGISNDRIDLCYNSARRAGALGGKITGAGGGGFLMLYCPVRRQSAVCREMARLGLSRMDFRFDTEGVKIIKEKEAQK